MPTRILRDGINDSEAVNSLSPRAEILYRRLISVVDDFGRYEASPKTLRGKAFGHQLDRWSEKDIEDALIECSAAMISKKEKLPLISLYVLGDKRYLQINNFGQRLRENQVSKYPDPPKVTGSSRRKPEVPGSSRKFPEKSAKAESESEPKAESNKTLSAATAAACETAATFDPTPSEPVEPPRPEIEIAIDRTVEAIHRRHPARRRCGPAEIRELLTAIVRKAPKEEKLKTLAMIDKNHALFCDTDQWQKENGEYAKGLDRWLAPTKNRWRSPPEGGGELPKTESGSVDYSKLPGHMNPGLVL